MPHTRSYEYKKRKLDTRKSDVSSLIAQRKLDEAARKLGFPNGLEELVDKETIDRSNTLFRYAFYVDKIGLGKNPSLSNSDLTADYVIQHGDYCRALTELFNDIKKAHSS